MLLPCAFAADVGGVAADAAAAVSGLCNCNAGENPKATKAQIPEIVVDHVCGGIDGLHPCKRSIFHRLPQKMDQSKYRQCFNFTTGEWYAYGNSKGKSGFKHRRGISLLCLSYVGQEKLREAHVILKALFSQGEGGLDPPEPRCNILSAVCQPLVTYGAFCDLQRVKCACV